MDSVAYGRDLEVVQRMKPEPMTPEEIAAQEVIDDIDYEIFVHKMNMIAQEGKETTMKLGASAGMRWGDVAFGIYTAQGDLSVVATGIWFHAVLGQIPAKYIVKHWVDEPSVGVKEGDSFFFNDPFYAGVHSADMGLVVPVFFEGKLVCFTGAAVHTGESGGTDPGGMCPNARSKYDDGLAIPPMKIGENYSLKEDVLNMFAAMTRDPRTMILDIKARLAAARIAERRIVELIKQKGVEFFMGALRRILSVTAEAARKRVRMINDGVYRQVHFMDTVGPKAALTKISLTAVKKGDKIRLDFDDTSPILQDRPMNTFFQGIIGLSMVYFCGWFLHDLPANNALLDILDWDFPKGIFINAEGDVSTSLAPMPQTCFSHSMLQCGARMTYSIDSLRAQAPWYVGFGAPIYGGVNQWGEPVADVTAELNATGAGARPDMDGVDGAGSWFATMSDCSDVETTESDRPFLYVFRNYFKNSYGHGKFRGGAGVGLGLMTHHVPMVMVASMGFGSKYPATQGLFGGYAVPPVFVQRVKKSNIKELMAKSDERIPENMDELYEESNPETGKKRLEHIAGSVQPSMNGDTIYVMIGGGAGYGDVLEREPELVMKDVRDGLCTHWAAKHLYKVSYNEKTLRLDPEETERLRDEARQERLNKATSYDEFEKDWLKLKPSEGIIEYYGTYPHPREGLTAG